MTIQVYSSLLLRILYKSGKLLNTYIKLFHKNVDEKVIFNILSWSTVIRPIKFGDIIPSDHTLTEIELKALRDFFILQFAFVTRIGDIISSSPILNNNILEQIREVLLIKCM